jgi:hypothetical protein
MPHLSLTHYHSPFCIARSLFLSSALSFYRDIPLSRCTSLTHTTLLYLVSLALSSSLPLSLSVVSFRSHAASLSHTLPLTILYRSLSLSLSFFLSPSIVTFRSHAVPLFLPLSLSTLYRSLPLSHFLSLFSLPLTILYRLLSPSFFFWNRVISRAPSLPVSQYNEQNQSSNHHHPPGPPHNPQSYSSQHQQLMVRTYWRGRTPVWFVCVVLCVLMSWISHPNVQNDGLFTKDLRCHLTVLIFTVLKFRTEIVLTVLIFRTEICLAVLKFLKFVSLFWHLTLAFGIQQ